MSSSKNIHRLFQENSACLCRNVPRMSTTKIEKSIKSVVTKPIRSSNFASRGQVDLIDMQASGETNLQYNFLLVYQDHLTKFVLRALKSKTAIEVTSMLHDICCLIGPPLNCSDNGREFKNVNLPKIVRELWPSCRIVYGKLDIVKVRVQWRVNREIKKVLGALMRKIKTLVGSSMSPSPNTP